MKVIAHRGNDEIHKENSMEAILNSLNIDYIDGVELDIRLTKDNKFVVNHDPFYLGHFISHTLLRRLQKLGVNSLDEILNKIDSDKIIMIEVKCDDSDIKKINKNLKKLLSKYNLNFYICSFNYKFIKEFKKSSDFKCGLIAFFKNDVSNGYDFDFILINKSIKEKVNLETFYFTVNKFNDLKDIKGNIITDFPSKFII